VVSGRHCLSLVGALLATLALPAGARADLLGAFGTSARSISQAGAGAALAEGYPAVTSCPATMAFGRPSLGVSFLGGPNRLGIALADRPAGYDPPALGGSSPVVPYEYRLRTREDPDDPHDLLGFLVGVSAEPGLPWLRLGLTAYVPLVGIGKQFTYFDDEREQYFSNTLHSTLYDSRLTALQFALGMSVRVRSWLALGAALRFSVNSESHARVFLPSAADQSVQEMNMQVTSGLEPGAIVGLAIRTLHDRLPLAFTFRDELVMSFEGYNEVQIKGFEGTAQYPFYQPMDFVITYSPREVVWATSLQTDPVDLSLDLTWSQWSHFRDGHNTNQDFSDTLGVSLGAELRTWGRARLLGGLGWRPSPVPDQTGRTNFVDNDMVRIGLGAAWDVDVLGNNLELALFSQLHLAVDRQTVKERLDVHPPCAAGVMVVCDEVPDDLLDPYHGQPLATASGLQTGNPGFPGYSSGGWVGIAGIQAQWRYP